MKPVDCVSFCDGECHNLLVFFIFKSSFLLAIIRPEEAAANAPRTPLSGIVARRPTTERAEARLVLENAVEIMLEPAALQLAAFLARLYFPRRFDNFWRLLCSEQLKLH